MGGMSAPTRWLTGLTAVLALGVAAAGCGSSSGRQVTPTQPHNLEVTNEHFETVDVFVDRRDVGQVNPGSSGVFRIERGERTVHVRERGSSTLRFLGAFDFDGTVVPVTYDPTRRNLFLENQAFFDVHVLIDGVEIAEVPPGEVLEAVVAPGQHDLSVREDGSSANDFVGTFDFPATSAAPIQVVYTP